MDTTVAKSGKPHPLDARAKATTTHGSRVDRSCGPGLDDSRSVLDYLVDLQHTAGNAATASLVMSAPVQRLVVARRDNAGVSATENTYIRVAGDITSTFESGGDYGKLQTVDAGGISYGKHQATLFGGNLHELVKDYVGRSQSAEAIALASYLPRLKAKEAALRNDQALLGLLKAAAKDPAMHKAQDAVFRRKYWDPAASRARKLGVKSALGHALLYDTTIQGGVKYRVQEAEAKLGGKIGAVVNGITITEQAFLLAFVEARIAAGIRQSERDKKNGAALVEAAKAEPNPAKAAAMRDKGKGLIRNGEAMLISATKTRGPTWKALVASGDLDLRGDASGMIELVGKKKKVRGLSGGATIAGDEAGTSVAGDRVKPTVAAPPMTAAAQLDLTQLIPAVVGLAFGGAGTLESLLRAVGVDVAPIIVGALAAAGFRDPNQLTNIVFWTHHPELTGSKLRPGQPGFAALSAQWLRLRNTVVIPALSRPAPAAPSRPAPAPAAPSKPKTSTSSPKAPAAAPTTTVDETPVASGLDALAAAARNDQVDAAVAKLRELERRSSALIKGKKTGKQANIGEQTGKERDELVADIAELRSMISALSASGLPAAQMKAIRAALFRGINAVSPFYYQHNNVIFEYDRRRGEKQIFNTCNITSLAMSLEALGKTAADYAHPHLIPQVAAFFGNEVATKAGDVTSTDVTGLRLPDFVGMVATVHHLGNRLAANTKEIAAAAGKAFNWIPNINSVARLSEYFGVTPTVGWMHAKALRAYGEKHHAAVDAQAGRRKQGKSTAAAGSFTTKEIEASVPSAQYKRDVLRVLRPALDAGSQVVVGQFNHFIRLQSVDDDWIVKDDPGKWTGEDFRVTWEEARALGLFNNYCILTG